MQRRAAARAPARAHPGALLVAPVLSLSLALAAPAPVGADSLPPDEGAGGRVDPAEGAGGEEEAEGSRSKAWSLGGLLGVYGGLSVWSYFAWYHDMPRTEFRVNGDGWFGRETYAGGADKLGHFWSNHAISRIGSEILIRGGWDPLPASLISSGLTFGFFTVVEVKDGYHYEFSVGDFAGNAAGAALAILMVNQPEVDRWLDVRVEYFPSGAYLDGLTERGDLDVAEDYSGQTYQLALHLEAIPGLWRGLRFFDLVGGFKTRNYKPEPADDLPRTQNLFFGVSLNMQSLLAEAFGPPEGGWRRAGHLAFELYSPPYTTLPAVEATRTTP